MRRAFLLLMAFICVPLLLLAGLPLPAGLASSGTPAASPTTCAVTTEDENEDIARRWHEEALNEGKLGVIDDIAAPDIVHRSVTFTDLTGPEGVKQNLRAALASFPDLHYTIEDVITEGNRVVVRWRAEGTQDGAFQGIAPTGKHLTWTGINIYRLECGRIAEVWTEVDGIGRLRQLGVLPGPGTPIP